MWEDIGIDKSLVYEKQEEGKCGEKNIAIHKKQIRISDKPQQLGKN